MIIPLTGLSFVLPEGVALKGGTIKTVYLPHDRIGMRWFRRD